MKNLLKVTLAIALFCIASSAHSAEAAYKDLGGNSSNNRTTWSPIQNHDCSTESWDGLVRFRYGYFDVSGDPGRFREDQWHNDQHRGGLDLLYLEQKRPEEGYHWVAEGRALYDDDYNAHFLAEKTDSAYIRADFTGHRHYYDGSNKFSTIPEIPDNNLFLDRRTYLVEVGLTPEDRPEVIVGWHRLENDGVQSPLRGVKGEDINGEDRYGVPGMIHQRGVTDNVYGEIGLAFCDDKYNIRVRPEFEQYNDHQFADFSSDKFYDEHLGYTSWRYLLLFDAFLTNNAYFSANYMYHDLSNESLRTVWRNGSLNYKEEDVDNTKKVHVGAGRYRQSCFFNVPQLTFDTEVRVEYAETSLASTGISYTAIMGSFDELRLRERAELTYRVCNRTTLSAEAIFEQRNQDWKWFSNNDRDSDIDFLKEVFVLKAVHRFNRHIKTTFKGRLKFSHRDYDEIVNTDEHYPGYIGDFRRYSVDLTSKTDIRLSSCAMATGLYQFLQEDIKTDLGGKTKHLTIHRAAGTLSWNVTDCFYVTGTGMYENYEFDTPVNVTDPECDWLPGSQPYDFRGDSYTVMVDGTYVFNNKTSTRWGYRHTEALGTVDFAGDYSYDQVDAQLTRQISEKQTVAVRYRYINHNNDGGSFNDYTAHGGEITYERTL